jgi:hypothetical protein
LCSASGPRILRAVPRPTGWMLLVFVAAGVAAGLAAPSCRRNSLYCDTSHPCSDSTRPFCDFNGRECVSAAPDLAGGACQVSAQCPNQMPICEGGSCRACSSSADNAECANHNNSTPYCNPATGACVQCSQSTECSGTTPICGSDGICRPCQTHAECPSGICLFDGASAGECADVALVAYVDNKGSVSTCNANGMVHDGNSPFTAFCDIPSGVSSPKPFVLVTGHGNTGAAYSSFSISGSTTKTIVGPGLGSSNPALIFDVTVDQVAVTASGGNTISLVLDGLEIGDRSLSNGHNGVSCTTSGGSMAKIAIRRSTIQRAGLFGITSTSCDITVDQSIVGPSNNSGGLYLKTSDFTLQNSVVQKNGSATSTFGGVQITTLGPAFRGNIINVDVLNNACENQNNRYSGIDCAMGTVSVLNTAVLGNTVGVPTGPVELRGTCSVDHSAFSGATGTNTNLANCTVGDVFAADFSPLTTAGGSCPTTVIGKGAAAFSGATAPSYDLNGAARPQPATSSSDIGAIESSM